jgi:hypothetical protein
MNRRQIRLGLAETVVSFLLQPLAVYGFRKADAARAAQPLAAGLAAPPA